MESDWWLLERERFNMNWSLYGYFSHQRGKLSDTTQKKRDWFVVSAVLVLMVGRHDRASQLASQCLKHNRESEWIKKDSDRQRPPGQPPTSKLCQQYFHVVNLLGD